MYWDILYNTESDKVPYADSFKHSSWLVIMKNRLEVAKQLLSLIYQTVCSGYDLLDHIFKLLSGHKSAV